MRVGNGIRPHIQPPNPWWRLCMDYTSLAMVLFHHFSIFWLYSHKLGNMDTMQNTSCLDCSHELLAWFFSLLDPWLSLSFVCSNTLLCYSFCGTTACKQVWRFSFPQHDSYLSCRLNKVIIMHEAQELPQAFGWDCSHSIWWMKAVGQPNKAQNPNGLDSTARMLYLKEVCRFRYFVLLFHKWLCWYSFYSMWKPLFSSCLKEISQRYAWTIEVLCNENSWHKRKENNISKVCVFIGFCDFNLVSSFNSHFLLT